MVAELKTMWLLIFEYDLQFIWVWYSNLVSSYVSSNLASNQAEHAPSYLTTEVIEGIFADKDSEDEFSDSEDDSSSEEDNPNATDES